MRTNPASAQDSPPPQNRIHPPQDHPPQAGDAPPTPAALPKRRGNPNLARIPRCGARTRAGCPCRAPAIHGKLRCRMHGGRSTGPRTKEGMARLRAARTTHGGYSADSRAFDRHHFTFLRRTSVRMNAVLYRDRLPPDLAARMTPIAPELLWPARPTRGITRAEDRAMLQAETASLAPWKQAIALARQARRWGRAAPTAQSGALTATQAKPLAPKLVADAAATASPASPAVPLVALAEPHAPIRPAPTRAAPQQASRSSGTHLVARPYAPKRAARGASSSLAPAGLAAQPRAAAPERAPGAAATGPVVARATPAPVRAEPLAPIPPAPALVAPDQALASTRTDPAARAHTTERAARGEGAPVPARLAARPKAHAPNHAPATYTGSRTLPVGRAARRWLRQQKLVHRNQPEGRQP